MSATKTVGDYEMGTTCLYDLDDGLYYCKMGVKNKKGELILQAIWCGISPEQAFNRAEAYCELMTNLKPPNNG